MKGLGFALPDGTLEKMAKSVDDDGAWRRGCIMSMWLTGSSATLPETWSGGVI